MKYIQYLYNYYIGYLKTHLRKRKSKSNGIFPDLGILNPSIGTTNLGDYIIYESVYSKIRETFPDGMITDFPTQLYGSYDTMRALGDKDLLFVSGTNLLTSNLNSYHQWRIHLGYNKFLKNNVILFGCGWWQYQGKINSYSKKIYKGVLSREFIHSTRDQYTVNKLNEIGINNVVNTSCPTLWSLSPEKCKLIPQKRGNNVVTTLTFYHKNHDLDFRMLQILSKNYEKVYLWIQGMDDLHYFNTINDGLNNIEIVNPTLEAYDNILELDDLDYIGTRLHAGVRALQKNKRTLILAVDNRAIEIGKDVNLNVIQRERVEETQNFIENSYETQINLPTENINLFIKSLLKK